MHAPAQFESSGSKISKFAVVALMHVGLVGALLSMKVLVTSTPQKPSVFSLPKPTIPVEPEVIKPPTMTETTPPPISIPTVLVDVKPLEELIITAERRDPVVSDGLPPVVKGGVSGGTGTTEVAAKAETPAKVYMAALANADACALPSYPAKSARNGDTGTVTLALLIGPDGKVGGSRIQRSSGYPELDRAAIAALKLCAFKPASTNGVPEAAWGQIAYVWTLD